MTTMPQVRQRHIALMRKTCQTLGHVLKHVSQETATTLRDGPEGWSVVEVVAHLRDFDGFFLGRAQLMLAQDQPQLPAYDHEALAIERNYNGQQLTQVYAALVESRSRFAAFFEQLNEAGWARTGIHPERGHFSMTDAVMQVGLHDLTHLEQITRILADIK